MRNDIPNEPGPLLLTARQAAQVLGISPRTLFSLTKNGDLPVVRFGRLVRYSPNDLRDWIESHTEGGGSNDQ